MEVKAAAARVVDGMFAMLSVLCAVEGMAEAVTVMVVTAVEIEVEVIMVVETVVLVVALAMSNDGGAREVVTAATVTVMPAMWVAAAMEVVAGDSGSDVDVIRKKKLLLCTK